MSTAGMYLLCLTVGFLAGVVFRDAYDMYRQSRKVRRMNKPHVPNSRAVLTTALVVAVLLQLLVGGLLVKTRIDQGEYVACTSKWQQGFASAYKARLTASTDSATALEAVVRAVDKEDPLGVQRAVDDYLALRATQVKNQQKNPYPPLPEELCGETP